MKKKHLIILLMMFIMAISCVPVLASTSTNEEVVFKAQEIKNWKDLEERMDKGITDDSAVQVRGTISEEIYTDEKGRQFKAIICNKKITSQKIMAVKTKEGKTENSYVANALVEARLEPIKANGNLRSISDSYDGDDYSHYTLGTAHVTLYYQMEPDVDVDGYSVNMFRPTSVSGIINRADSQIVFDDIRVQIQGVGDYYSDSQGQNYVGFDSKVDSVYDSMPDVGSYYTKTASKTHYWWPIYPGAFSDTLEGATKSTMHRGGTSWDLAAYATFDDTHSEP